MGLLGAVAVKLGEVVVKFAVEAVSGQKVAGDAAGGVTVVLAGRAVDQLDRRRAKRQLDAIADVVAEHVLSQCGHEFRGLTEPAREVVVEAVGETLGLVPAADLVLGADFEPDALYRRVRELTRGYLAGRFFSQDETDLYARLLRMACSQVVEIVRGLPNLADAAVPELLRRLGELEDAIRDAPRRALVDSARDSDTAFADLYRQYASEYPDLVDLDSERLTTSSRRYPLGVAYLSLPARMNQESVSVEQALARHSRLFVRAECGAGKTTGLRRLFMLAAAQGFTGELARLNATLPFYVPLHLYSGGELPTLDEFIGRVGQEIAAEMPAGWMRRQLESRDCLVLLNGADEVDADQRPGVLDWIAGLSRRFPRARLVLVARPGAVPDDWPETSGFAVVDLLALGPGDAREFIRRWHDAVKSTFADATARAEVDACGERLLQALTSCHALRALSTNPLTCALMCALHRDGRVQLPDQWLDLLRIVVEILICERDRDRGLPDQLELSVGQRIRTLQDLAYWVTTERLTDPGLGDALERVEHLLGGTAVGQVHENYNVGAKAILDHLAGRSGLIHVGSSGALCFTSTIFRDYLAAREAVFGGNLRSLLRDSHLPERQHLVTMAAGHAPLARAEELLSGLLARAAQEAHHRDRLHVLAQACLRIAPGLGTELRQRVDAACGMLVPRTTEQADVLAAAGPLVVDALAQQPTDDVEIVEAIIVTATRIGGDDVLPLLGRLATDPRPVVRQALLDAWPAFHKLAEYARVVLCNCPPAEQPIVISDPALIEAATHVPWLRPMPHTQARDHDGPRSRASTTSGGGGRDE